MHLVPRLSIVLCAGVLSLAPSGPARAVVDLCDAMVFPGCIRDFGSCEFDIEYGNSGVVRALGALHVAGQGTLINPQIVGQTDLTLSCSVVGQGTDRLTVMLGLQNDGVAATANLTYFAEVNPDGNAGPSSPNLQLYDVPGAVFPPGGPDLPAPDAYGIDDLDNLNATLPGNIDYEIFVDAALSNTDFCGALCNVVLALQWDIGVLQPGESILIKMAYSDAGSAISSQFLTAARADDLGSADDPGTVLTISGLAPSALAVPLLGDRAMAWLGAALLGISALLARHQATRSASTEV